MTLNNNWKVLLSLVVLALLLGRWIQVRHADDGTYNWQTALWADQTGYYVYLPALFVYDLDAAALPPDIVERTGQGFRIDRTSGKIFTKYTCGVAMLQSPFFLAMHAFHHLKRDHQDGFSGAYHHVPHWAAWFYGVLGLFLLYLFLRHYYTRSVSANTVALLFLGTNLCYYTLEHTGMSHVYSFFLGTLLLYGFKKINPTDAQTLPMRWLWTVGLAAALMVLIRPTNAIFVGLALLLDVKDGGTFWARLRWLLQPRVLLVGVVSLAMVWLPQLLYWRYASGSWFLYSYEQEGFTYWAAPKLAAVWFAPHNGLFSYSPLLFLLPFLVLWLQLKRTVNVWQSGLAFLLVSYLCGAWHIYSFGCGFGARNFVEYSALFALPFGAFLAWLGQQSWKKWAWSIVLLSCVLVTQKLFHTFDRCFFGEGDWDTEEYRRLLMRGYHRQSIPIDPEELDGREFLAACSLVPKETWTGAPYERLYFSADIAIDNPDLPTYFVVETYVADTMAHWQRIPIQPYLPVGQQKKHIRALQWLHHDFPLDQHYLKVYLWNPDGARLEIDQLTISLE